MPPNRRRRSQGGAGGRRSRLVLGFLVGVALSMVVSSVGAAGVIQAEGSPFEEPRIAQSPGAEAIAIGVADARYMNRLFREVDHELGFCGKLTDDRPARLEVWLANTLDAGPDHVEFITTNCPDGMGEVLLHTHPSGTISLSEEDVRVLRAGPETMLCVQAGALPVSPGREADDLACYREGPPGEPSGALTRVGVRTAGSVSAPA